MSGADTPSGADARRLFVALPVAADVAERLDAAVAPLRSRREVRWTRPAGWHVTLAFLGDVTAAPADVVDVAAPAVATAAAELGLRPPGLELSLGAAGSFSGRTLHVEVVDEPDGAVAALGKAIQTALADADLPVKRRRVTGHLTLARARGRRRVPRRLVAEVPEVAATWTVPAAVLYESILGRGPARYEPVGELSLAGD